MWTVILVLAFCTGSRGTSLVNTFNCSTPLNHLAIDRNTGRVYVGAVNRIHSLTPELNVLETVVTGPVDEFDGNLRRLKDNVNKALVIDYDANRLISCGSASEGLCSVYDIRNITGNVRKVKEMVVANDATSSTVAFIAPGPSEPPVSHVLYVGVTYTGNSPYRIEIPAVSSRSLAEDRLFTIAHLEPTSGTRIFVNSLARERYPINYIYGFSSEGFSYFLTTQLKHMYSDIYHSKLVRVCQDDENYYSYIETEISCTGKEDNINYNLVQAAYVGKAGSTLAQELGITPDGDVLYAGFSKSDAGNGHAPSNLTTICVYSLKAIRRKFMQNIRTCFSGKGDRGLDFITPSNQCLRVKMSSDQVTEDFCGFDVNTPLDGNDPVTATSVATYNERLTAVAATVLGDLTVLFAGTAQGHLKKMIIESAFTASEYEDLVIDTGSPVNKDLFFDAQQSHIYVMTETKVSKIRVSDCSAFKTCLTCLDPFCGWCSLENKCSPRSECDDEGKDPSYWLPYRSNRCPVITEVTPNRLHVAAAQVIDLKIENFPVIKGPLFCKFDILDKVVYTKIYKQTKGISCMSPSINTLTSISTGHNFTVSLSLSSSLLSNTSIVITNVTYFDCNSYTSCTQCVGSEFPCNWNFSQHKCSYATKDPKTKGNLVITGIKPAYFFHPNNVFGSGPSSCPKVKFALDNSAEIIVHEYVNKFIGIHVELYEAMKYFFSFQCQFKIENQVIVTSANLSGDTIQCETTALHYNSDATNVTAEFNILSNGNPLDNPNNVRLLIYRCNQMVDNCGLCQKLPMKYDCGWCGDSNRCQDKRLCKVPNTWINHTQVCPHPKIRSFMPQSSSWDASTNITIEGINLGRQVSDIHSITVAGVSCLPIAHLYIEASRIVCTTEGPGENTPREGPVVIQILTGDKYRDVTEKKYMFVNPTIKKINPSIGPKSGGTLIAIEGDFLNAGGNISVLIGKKKKTACVVQTISSSKVTCKSRPSLKSQHVELQMMFDNAVRINREHTFQYVEDAIVRSVESNHGFLSGGLEVKVTGLHFHAIQAPQMYVLYKDKMYFGPCRHVDHQTKLICFSPAIDEDVPHLEIDNPLQLEYGFIMDDIKQVQNLSKALNSHFSLYPDPSFVKIKKMKFLDNDVIYLTIDVKNITQKYKPEDIEILVGNNKCVVISIKSNEIGCFSSLDVFARKDEATTVVKMGNLNFDLGKLFLNTSEAAHCMCWTDTNKRVFGSLTLTGESNFDSKDKALARWTTKTHVDRFVISN